MFYSIENYVKQIYHLPKLIYNVVVKIFICNQILTLIMIFRLH